MLIALNNKIFKQQKRQISIKIQRLKTFVVKCKVAYTTEPKSQSQGRSLFNAELARHPMQVTNNLLQSYH